MNSFSVKRLLLPFLATLGLLLVIGWMAGLFSNKVTPEMRTMSADQAHNAYVVSLRARPRVESVPAGVRAQETTRISSRIIARIDKIHVRAGDRVTKGQPLITLESSAIQAQIAQENARVASIQAQLDEARLTLQRTKSLKDKGLASNSDLDKAQANFSKLSSDLQAALQSEKQARTALSYSNIVSPIDGRIVERSSEPGNMASPGQPLLSLYNPLSLLVEANVRESLAIALKIGQQITLKIDALNKTITANISEKVPAADPNARSFVVKANIPFDQDLLPGMFARMDIELENIEQLMIPAQYISTYGQLNMVWVFQDKRLSRRFVRVGDRIDKDIVVVSGLEIGEVISMADFKPN